MTMETMTMDSTMDTTKEMTADGTRAPGTAPGASAPLMGCRPEDGDGRVLRSVAGFFRAAERERLSPVEMAVAWQRIAAIVVREAEPFPVGVSELLRALARELDEALPSPGARLAEMAEEARRAAAMDPEAEELLEGE